MASSGKPDGEFVEKCLNAVAEEVCPEENDAFNAVSLSASTITRRIEEIGGNVVYAQLQQKTKELDLRARTCKTQRSCLQSLKGTTTGEDTFGKVCETMEELDLDWSKAVCCVGAVSLSSVSQPACFVVFTGKLMRESCKQRCLQAYWN